MGEARRPLPLALFFPGALVGGTVAILMILDGSSILSTYLAFAGAGTITIAILVAVHAVSLTLSCAPAGVLPQKRGTTRAKLSRSDRRPR